MTKKDGKPCERCGTSEWYTCGSCKKCTRDRAEQWRRDNPERSRESDRRWRADNPERKRESDRNWRRKNRDKERERKRKWKRDNPKKARKWQLDNPEKYREIVRNWERNNPEKISARYHRRRTRKTGAGGSYTAEEFKQLCNQYDNRCLGCGKKKRLTADHVVPVIAGGSSDISNIQPLCNSCNSKKGAKTIDYRTKTDTSRWIQGKLFD